MDWIANYRASWENLLKQLTQREQRLHAAGEIHRFHRDVAEALFRIQVRKSKILIRLWL
jgi:hypothetical protein